MIETTYGKLKVGNRIDITDPCYDEDVWCRINNFPIPPGEYECYTLTADNQETSGWGKRIARIGIRTDEADYFEDIGIIGVDAGMAGFFIADNRRFMEEEIMRHDCDDVFKNEEGFCSSSGYGDGSYTVVMGTKHGKIVEVYIEFIGEDE